MVMFLNWCAQWFNRRARASRPVVRARRPRLSLELMEDRLLLSTFTVTSAADTVDPQDNVLTLREAILAANGHANSLNPGGAADEIHFNIPGPQLNLIN